MSGRGAPLPREFFARPALEVARSVLGCVLQHDSADGLVAVLLTEAEAYEGAMDPASHAYRGRTARNAVMFGPPGHAYVYFTYGMHFCVNLVCQPEGTASAVLLRAGRVVAGISLAAARRVAGRNGAAPGAGTSSSPERSGRPVAGPDLARGPARLCQALGIGRAQDGADVCDPAAPLRIYPGTDTGGDAAEPHISYGPRVGISAAAERPWRFWLTGDPTVSAYRPHVPRSRQRPEQAGPARVSPPSRNQLPPRAEPVDAPAKPVAAPRRANYRPRAGPVAAAARPVTAPVAGDGTMQR